MQIFVYTEIEVADKHLTINLKAYFLQTYNMSCPICLNSLNSRGGPHKLPCGHGLHKKCIKNLYSENKFRYDEETMEKFRPECPLCRRRIHKEDLPDYRPKTLENLRPHELKWVNTPAYAAIPYTQKKVRLSRTRQLLQKQERAKALEKLIQQRSLLQKRIATQLEESPVRAEGSPVRLEKSPSSSQASKLSSQHGVVFGPSDLEDGFLPRNAAPRYSIPDPPSPLHPIIHSRLTQRDRSRSPASSMSSGRLQIGGLSQEEAQECSPSSSKNVSNLTSSLEASNLELQDLDMYINIIQSQIEFMETPRRHESSPTFSEDSSDDEVDDDDDDEPEEVEGHVGKGRNARYVIRWKSGQKTLNRTKEVEELANDLLKKYRAFLNRKYVAEHRANKKLETTSKK